MSRLCLQWMNAGAGVREVRARASAHTMARSGAVVADPRSVLALAIR